MRHTNLKEKLDNVKQDFDKEALWNKINNRPKRRWSLLWILGFLIGSLAVGTFAISRYKFLQDDIYSKSRNATTPKSLSTEYFKLKSDKQILNQKVVQESQSSKVLGKPQDELILSNNVFSNKSIRQSIENEISNIKSPIIISHPSIDIAKTTDNSNKEVSYSQEKELLYYNKENHEDESQSKLEDATIQDSSTIKIMEAGISLLELLHPQVNSDKRDTISMVYVENEKRNMETLSAKNNMIGLSIGLGLDNHRFSDFRSRYEKSLESQFLSFLYHRKISSHFSLQTKLTYCVSQTNVTYTSVDTTIRINVQNKAVKSWSGNKYDLYNQYHRLDASVSMGYNIEIGKSWQLRPSIGLGINIMHKEHGDIWDREYSRQSLEQLDEYDKPTKSFMLYQLLLSKSMANNYCFGLGLSIQSLRSLANGELYNHQIRPMSIDAIFGKNF